MRQIYTTEKSESTNSTIIKNPYELDSCELKSINSSYDLSVLNTSIGIFINLALFSMYSLFFSL